MAKEDEYEEYAFQNAYNAGSKGVSWEDVAATFTGPNAGFLQYAQPGWEAGNADWTASQQAASEPSFAEQLGALFPTYEPLELPDPVDPEIARKEQGLQDREDLFGERFTAAKTATDYITGEISTEAANARLLGIDYVMNDDIKQSRINDYFGTLWTQPQEDKLLGLFDEWDPPEGFTEFEVVIGDGSSVSSNRGREYTKAVSRPVGASRNTPTGWKERAGSSTTFATGSVESGSSTVFPTEDEDTLGAKNVLGV